MKKLTLLSFALAALVAIPAATMAADGDDVPKSVHKHAGALAKFDSNGDGKLDRSERRAAQKARRARMLSKYDSDGDGQLGQLERDTMAAERAAKRFKLIDTNGDGQLSLAEFEAGMKQAGKRHGKRRGKRHGQRGGGPSAP